jgi:hypothetical protein
MVNKINYHLPPKERLNSDGVMVNNSNNNFSPKESLNSNGEQFYQYQQSKTKFKQ